MLAFIPPPFLPSYLYFFPKFFLHFIQNCIQISNLPLFASIFISLQIYFFSFTSSTISPFPHPSSYFVASVLSLSPPFIFIIFPTPDFPTAFSNLIFLTFISLFLRMSFSLPFTFLTHTLSFP